MKQQKVILVQKRPAKAATMVADDYDYDSQRQDIPEKSVSFSSEDEILEIESRPLPKQFNIKKPTNINSIKTRLGIFQGTVYLNTRHTNNFCSCRTWNQ